MTMSAPTWVSLRILGPASLIESSKEIVGAGSCVDCSPPGAIAAVFLSASSKEMCGSPRSSDGAGTLLANCVMVN